MEVAIGEYETDMDKLCEAAQNKCKIVLNKATATTGNKINNHVDLFLSANNNFDLVFGSHKSFPFNRFQ